MEILCEAGRTTIESELIKFMLVGILEAEVQISNARSWTGEVAAAVRPGKPLLLLGCEADRSNSA